MNTRSYGYTISTKAGKTRRAKPSGSRSEVLAKASRIIREDETIARLIVWTTRGNVIRELAKSETGKIIRVK